MGDTVKLEIIVDDKGSLVIKNFKDVVKGSMGDVSAQSLLAESSMSSLFKNMSLATAVGGLIQKAFGGVQDILVSSTKEFMNSQAVHADMVEAARGLGLATESNIKRFDTFADTIMATTTISGEMTRTMLALGMTMKVPNERLEESVKLSIGLGKAYATSGLDATTAMKGISAAMQGNYGQLSRYIPALMTAKTEQEKWTIVQKAGIDGFRREEESIKTDLGAWKQFGNYVNDFKGQFGGVLVGIIKFLLSMKEAILAAAAAMGVLFVVGKINTWVTALKAGEGALMSIVQRAQLLQTAGVGGISSFAQSINFASGKVSGLSGVLQNLPAVGAAAFAGMGIGAFINDTLGAGKAIQWMVDKLSFPQSWYDQMSASARGLSDHSKAGAAAAASIRSMAKDLGDNSGSLRANAASILQNKEAFSKLSPEIQVMVTRLAAVPPKVDATRDSLSLMATVLSMINPALIGLGKVIDIVFQNDMQDRLVAHAEAVQRAREEYEALSKSLGFLSKTAMQDVKTETASLIKLVKEHDDQLSKSGSLQKKVWEDSVRLMQSYALASQPIPQGLQDIIDKLRPLMTLQEKMRDIKIELPDGKVWSEPYVDSFKNIDAELNKFFGDMDAGRTVLDEFGNEIIVASGEVIKFNKDLAKIGDIGLIAAFALIELRGMLEDLGYELNEQEEGLWNFGEGLINIGESLIQGDVMGVISGVVKAIGGLAKAIFGHKQTAEEFTRQMQEEQAAADALASSFVNLSGTISGMVGWDTASLEKYTKLMKDAIEQFTKFGATESAILGEGTAAWMEQFGSAFSALMDKAKKAGQEGSASIIEMFESMASKGIKVAEIQEYINGKLESAADAYAGLQDKIAASTVAQEVFGNISVPILDEIIAYRKELADNKDLVDSIKLATTMMVDFTDATRISQDQYNQFTASAGKSFDALKKGGMDSSQAIQAMGPYLQRLQFLHEQYGFTIDANTQSILDQAIKDGVVTKNKVTETGQIIGLLEVIAKQLGADIPDALGLTSKAATDAFKSASKEAGKFKDVLDDLGVPRAPTIPGAPNPKRPNEIPAAIGYQGWVAGGSYTRFLTGEPGEDEYVSITPRSKMRGSDAAQGGSWTSSRSGSDSAAPAVSIVVEDHSVITFNVDPKSGIDQNDLTAAMTIVIKDNRQQIADTMAAAVARKL